ncbi:MAG: tRNA (N6-isopentenyl adenosine(37)-C2)-methylthiotransferase MiaB [Oscillospiraceae bacterium]|jgi:tRNA-2-methylthio-N6-dimethylallyladenosine synthase|nr:tRNA (N6-isopentenyl adenosine(37)-C2)-methylthiotransferase MiaB [Oscillospiraceae bacterium]
MTYKRTEITPAQIENQLSVCQSLNRRLASRRAFVDTFGCQQNESDSELLRGYFAEMGCTLTQNEAEADIIVLNTCAVREHAEQRVFGNLGGFTHLKRANPELIVCVCGCMAAQKRIAEKIKKSYSLVNLVFGPDELWRFPELLQETIDGGKRVFATGSGEGSLVEGLPRVREAGVRAWLSIMYGCNNFCSYCIVPYTRGRERSRRAEDVVAEARGLIESGYKDLTLLGQNVNSYGKDLSDGISFAQLIREINAIPGDFVIRFMTSHPKDATEELFSAMADCSKCENHLHLPLQAGSDEILRRMNRGYTAKEYLALAARARSFIPELVLTTDIIVGFPGESEKDFAATLEVVEKARFDAMFTFIYSKRAGTPAATLPDPYTRAEKQAHFDRLIELQNQISAEKHAAYVGKTLRVLIDGFDREEGFLTARTRGGRLVRLPGTAADVGKFAQVTIDGSNTWALKGQIIDNR